MPHELGRKVGGEEREREREREKEWVREKSKDEDGSRREAKWISTAVTGLESEPKPVSPSHWNPLTYPVTQFWLLLPCVLFWSNGTRRFLYFFGRTGQGAKRSSDKNESPLLDLTCSRINKLDTRCRRYCLTGHLHWRNSWNVEWEK